MEAKKKKSSCRFSNATCDAELVLMTQNIVDTLLAHNDGNRKINKANLAKIEDDVRRGEYTFTGQPIIRDDHGRLLDGQHRLMAFANCGYPPVKCLLVTVHGDNTMTTNAYLHMDSGVSRQFRVFLAHEGVADHFQVGALCKKLTYMESEYGRLSPKSDTDLKRVYLMYADEIALFAPLVKRIKGFNANMGAACCAIARVSGCGKEIAELIKRAALGDMLKIGTPAHTLNKVISQGRSIDCRGTGHDQFSFSVVAHAIIAELNNEQYPVMNRNVKKAIAWIREMAESNKQFILPSQHICGEKEDKPKTSSVEADKS